MPLTIYYNWLSMHLCICHQIKPLVFAQVILANNPVQMQDLRAWNCCDAKKCTWDNMKTFVQHNKTYCHFQLPIRCITKASGKLHTVQILTSNMDFPSFYSNNSIATPAALITMSNNVHQCNANRLIAELQEVLSLLQSANSVQSSTHALSQQKEQCKHPNQRRTC